MKEVVFDIEEFKAKIDLNKAIHHSCTGKYADKHGILYDMTFRIYGISKFGDHIIVFQAWDRIDTIEIPGGHGKRGNFFRDRYLELVEKYAKPLGSTEGEWKE